MLAVVSSSVISPHEHLVEDILSSEDALREAASSINQGRPLKMLLQCYPRLNQAVLKLASTITHLYPVKDSPSKSLLAMVLADGMASYRKAAALDRGQQEMVACFLDAMFNRAADIMDFDAYATDEMGEGEKWPFLQVPLAEWASSKKGRRLIFVPRNGTSEEKQMAKIMLIGRLATMKEAMQIQRVASKLAL